MPTREELRAHSAAMLGFDVPGITTGAPPPMPGPPAAPSSTAPISDVSQIAKNILSTNVAAAPAPRQIAKGPTKASAKDARDLLQKMNAAESDRLSGVGGLPVVKNVGSVDLSGVRKPQAPGALDTEADYATPDDPRAGLRQIAGTLSGSYVAPHLGLSEREVKTKNAFTQPEIERGVVHSVEAIDAQKEAEEQAIAADQYRASLANAQGARELEVRQEFQPSIDAIRAARFETEKQRTQSADAALAAARAPLDAQAYDNSRSTGQKVADTAAMILGTFGSGPENAGVRGIENKRAQSLELQRANHELASRDAAAQQGALGREEELYDAHLARKEGDIRSQLGAEQGALAQHVAEMYPQQAQAATAARVAEAKAHEAKGLAETSDRYARMLHGETETTEKEKMQGGGSPTQKGFYVPTLGGFVKDAETQRKLNGEGAMRLQIQNNIDQIHKLKSEAMSTSSFTPAGRLRLQQIDEQLDAARNDILTSQTVLKGQGAMSKGDMEVSNAAMSLGSGVQGRPDFMIKKDLENLREVRSRNLVQHRLSGEAYGIHRGAETYVDGPGGPVEKQVLYGQNRAPSHETVGLDDLATPKKGKPNAR